MITLLLTLGVTALAQHDESEHERAASAAVAARGTRQAPELFGDCLLGSPAEGVLTWTCRATRAWWVVGPGDGGIDWRQAVLNRLAEESGTVANGPEGLLEVGGEQVEALALSGPGGAGWAAFRFTPRESQLAACVHGPGQPIASMTCQAMVSFLLEAGPPLGVPVASEVSSLRFAGRPVDLPAGCRVRSRKGDYAELACDDGAGLVWMGMERQGAAALDGMAQRYEELHGVPVRTPFPCALDGATALCEQIGAEGQPTWVVAHGATPGAPMFAHCTLPAGKSAKGPEGTGLPPICATVIRPL